MYIFSNLLLGLKISARMKNKLSRSKSKTGNRYQTKKVRKMRTKKGMQKGGKLFGPKTPKIEVPNTKTKPKKTIFGSLKNRVFGKPNMKTPEAALHIASLVPGSKLMQQRELFSRISNKNVQDLHKKYGAEEVKKTAYEVYENFLKESAKLEKINLGNATQIKTIDNVLRTASVLRNKYGIEPNRNEQELRKLLHSSLNNTKKNQEQLQSRANQLRKLLISHGKTKTGETPTLQKLEQGVEPKNNAQKDAEFIILSSIGNMQSPKTSYQNTKLLLTNLSSLKKQTENPEISQRIKELRNYVSQYGNTISHEDQQKVAQEIEQLREKHYNNMTVVRPEKGFFRRSNQPTIETKPPLPPKPDFLKKEVTSTQSPLSQEPSQVAPSNLLSEIKQGQTLKPVRPSTTSQQSTPYNPRNALMAAIRARGNPPNSSAETSPPPPKLSINSQTSANTKKPLIEMAEIMAKRRIQMGETNKNNSNDW